MTSMVHNFACKVLVSTKHHTSAVIPYSHLYFTFLEDALVQGDLQPRLIIQRWRYVSSNIRFQKIVKYSFFHLLQSTNYNKHRKNMNDEIAMHWKDGGESRIHGF